MQDAPKCLLVSLEILTNSQEFIARYTRLSSYKRSCEFFSQLLLLCIWMSFCDCFYPDFQVAWLFSHSQESVSLGILPGIRKIIHCFIQSCRLVPIFAMFGISFLKDLQPYPAWNTSSCMIIKFKPAHYLDGWPLGNIRCCTHVCAGGVMYSSLELEIGDPSSKSNFFRYIHLRPNVLQKG